MSKVKQRNYVNPYLQWRNSQSPFVFWQQVRPFGALCTSSEFIIIIKFIPQVLDAIYTVLKDDYLQCLTSQEDFTEIADQTHMR